MDYGEGPKSPGTNPERSTPESVTPRQSGFVHALFSVSLRQLHDICE